MIVVVVAEEISTDKDCIRGEGGGGGTLNKLVTKHALGSNKSDHFIFC